VGAARAGRAWGTAGALALDEAAGGLAPALATTCGGGSALGAAVTNGALVETVAAGSADTLALRRARATINAAT
jgi:hypothetical protein